MHQTRWIWLAAVVALALSATPALAAWGLGGWFGGVATQSRVIQICMVTIGIALFIMLKKAHHR